MAQSRMAQPRMAQSRIDLPATREALSALRAGDRVLLYGQIYTGRDAAHRRMDECLRRGEPLPIPLLGQAIYYVGPCPAPPGRPIGACGPTTSGRMDAYAPALLERGLLAMIGKGQRSAAVKEAMVRAGAVYFAATGGAGALLMQCVTACERIAYEDLGTEAIHRLTVEGMPAIVAIDSMGNDLYETGPREYARG